MAATQTKQATDPHAPTREEVRIAFLEATVTVLTRELAARGITPPTFEDHVIGEAESLMDARLAHDKGRAGLVAAFIPGED